MKRRFEPKYTVESLIKELQKMDGKLPVVMSQDPEGNGYSPFYQMDVCNFDFDNYEIMEEDGDKALVMWP